MFSELLDEVDSDDAIDSCPSSSTSDDIFLLQRWTSSVLCLMASTQLPSTAKTHALRFASRTKFIAKREKIQSLKFARFLSHKSRSPGVFLLSMRAISFYHRPMALIGWKQS